MKSGQQERDELQQQWASLMEEAASLDEVGNYREAIIKGEAALNLAKNLSSEDLAITLNLLAGSYQKQGLYTCAEPYYLHSLEINERALGKDHPSVAINLINLADLYQEQALYERAEPLYLRSLEISEQSLGKDHLAVADALNYLAMLYRDQGLYDRAEPLYLRSLKIRERTLGNNHRDVADLLNNLADLYEKKGLYERVELLYLRSLEIYGRVLRKDHLLVANTLNNLANFYSIQGQFNLAERCYLRCLKIRELALGKDHLLVADVLVGLANLYQLQALYERVEPLYLRSLEIYELVLGRDHLRVAKPLNGLAVLYENQGLYERVKPLYLRCLEIEERVLGKDHPSVATTLNNLANLYQHQGLYDCAEQSYSRSLEIKERILGKDHPSVANPLNGLAVLYENQGLYNRAEPLYMRCLEIKERILGKDHPSVAATLNNLANLYQHQGLYDRAKQSYLCSLEIYERVLGKDNISVTRPLSGLAILYSKQGLYEHIEPLYMRCLEIEERVLGKDHPSVAITLNGLANLYKNQGLYERVEPLYMRCLEIEERVLGKDHLSVATTLNSLANLYREQGAYDRAKSLYLRSLKIRKRIFGRDHLEVSTTLNSLAKLHRKQGLYARSEFLYVRSLEIDERLLGKDHPEVSTTFNGLASLYQEQGLYNRALEHHQKALNRQYNFIRYRLAHISESEHKLYLKDIKSTLESLLSLTYHHLNTSQPALSIALDAVLLAKNLSAAALAARNAIVHSGDPELQSQLHRIRELIARSNSLEYNDPQQPQLRNEIRESELEIARIAPEVMLPDALQVDRQAIALKLPAESCLVEFISFGGTQNDRSSARYLAFIYAPDNTKLIRMVDLGLATEIDDLIDSCRKSIQNIYNSVETAAPCVPDEIEEFPLESLAPIQTRIIDPLHLDGVAHAIIAPDGALSFLPFQLFLPDCLVSYLSTGRDLVRVAGQKPAGDSLVIADPDYANRPTELHLVSSQPQIESDRVLVAGVKDLNNWRQLTSFGILGKAIAGKLKVPYYKQRSATKARLTQSQCPHILSILTHGFALPKTDADELDPMTRSGLAFCGANHGAEYLLLANEVATLDLHNNELTLLVACQTALGDVAAGEGVYGLRRAFALAGAKTLIATLWEIPVYASVILIERFIDNLESYMGKAAALKEAQMYLRDIDVATLDLMPVGKIALAELHGTNYDLDDSFQPFSHPYFWAAWICQGDTGAMKYVIAKDLDKFSIDGKVVNLRIQK
jgi:tetratricopeptide (TPR) repeat protein